MPTPRDITDEIRVDVPTGKNGASSVPGLPKARVSARPDREYVAGGQYLWTASFVRTLPFYIDQLSADFGDDIYERMCNDPQVSSCVQTLKLSVLADGLTLLPAISKGKPNYNKAVEIRDFCSRVLDSMKQPLTVALYDLLDAFAFGNRVAEILWDIPNSGELSGKMTIKALKVKPRRSVAFVVDVYTNVLAIMGLIPGQASPLLTESVIGLAGIQAPNLLPRDKFAILTFRPKNNDPRGQSCLRAAYNPWWMKQQLAPEHLKYLAQFAVPSLVGTTAEGAVPIQEIDAGGVGVYDDEGNPKIIKPEEAMMVALQEFRNGTVMVVPSGADVKPIEVGERGEVFDQAYSYFDRQITQAILLQPLATTEGVHQTRAATESHGDILGLLIQHGKEHAENMLETDILRQIVLYNFGEKYLALLPKASLSETEQHDFKDDAGAISGLFQAGYLDVSQLTDLDARLGLSERTADEMQAREDKADMALQQAQAAAAGQNGQGPGQNGQGGSEGDSSPSGDNPKGGGGNGSSPSDGGDPTMQEIASAFGDGDPAPSAFVFFAQNDNGEKGHWAIINGRSGFVKEDGGQQITKRHINAATKTFNLDPKVTAQLQEAREAGRIHDEKDLHHTLVIARAAHDLAIESGKLKPGTPFENTQAVRGASHLSLDQLKANAENHSDPAVKAQAQALLVHVSRYIKDKEPGSGDLLKSLIPPSPTPQEAQPAQEEAPDAGAAADTEKPAGEDAPAPDALASEPADEKADEEAGDPGTPDGYHTVSIDDKKVPITGEAVTKQHIKDAMQEFDLSPSAQTHLFKGLAEGTIKTDKDLFHTVAIAKATHELAQALGHTKKDSRAGGSAMGFAAQHRTFEGLKQAADNGDEKAQAILPNLVPRISYASR